MTAEPTHVAEPGGGQDHHVRIMLASLGEFMILKMMMTHENLGSRGDESAPRICDISTPSWEPCLRLRGYVVVLLGSEAMEVTKLYCCCCCM
jgi:hypothetical protein